MQNQKTQSDMLWHDLTELVKEFEGGNISFEETTKTLTCLSEHYQQKKVTIQTNNRGVNILQVAIDHFIEHMDDCVDADDCTFDEDDLAVVLNIKEQLREQSK